MLRRILEKITGRESFYKSPTDMGVNRAGFAIVDDAVVQEAAKQEILRRYFRYRCEYAMGFADKETVQRVELLVKDFNLGPEHRPVVVAARQAAIERRARRSKGNKGIYCGAAIELPDGTIVTGTNSPLMHAASSLVLNAAKQLAEIPAKIHLLPPSIIGVHQPPQEGDPAASSPSAWTSRRRCRPEHQRDDQPGRRSWRWRSSASCGAARCT